MNAEQAEALLASITPGPWRVSFTDETVVVSDDIEVRIGGEYDDFHTGPLMSATATAIAALPDALATVVEQAARIEALEAEKAELRGLLWYAWSEFNAIRARSGAPLSRDGMLLCDDGYWSLLTDKFAAAIGDKDLKPWPSDDARAALAQGER